MQSFRLCLVVALEHKAVTVAAYPPVSFIRWYIKVAYLALSKQYLVTEHMHTPLLP
jgi:hypothetical protein